MFTHIGCRHILTRTTSRSLWNSASSTSRTWSYSRFALKGGRKQLSSAPQSLPNTEGTLIYDKVSKQPLMLTVFSIITTTSFVVLEITRDEMPENSPTVIRIFGSPIWNYVGAGLGLLGIFLSTKYPKFLISEVTVAGKKVFIRTHTLLGHKSPQEVFDLSDLMRIKSTSSEYVNWKSVSTPRRFVVSKTEEIEKLVPFGFNTTPTPTGPTISNVGGKTLTEAKMYERALRERWTKKARHESK